MEDHQLWVGWKDIFLGLTHFLQVFTNNRSMVGRGEGQNEIPVGENQNWRNRATSVNYLLVDITYYPERSTGTGWLVISHSYIQL